MPVTPLPPRGRAAPDPPRTDVTALGTVLRGWAHPDDEAFLSGG